MQPVGWRVARDRELVETKERLRDIGRRSREAKTLVDDRAREVHRALEMFDRKELSLREVGEMVDLTYEMVRLIRDGRGVKSA